MKELPHAWIWTTLGDLCAKPQYGWTASATENSTEFRLLRTTDISTRELNWKEVPYASNVPENTSAYTVNEGDIFVSRAGARAGVSVLIAGTPPKALFASYLIRITPLVAVTASYLRYFLQSPGYWAQILNRRLGIAQPNINAVTLTQVRVPLPPLAEQNRIVAEIEKQFTRLDSALRSLCRIKQHLEHYRDAILRAAFDGSLVPPATNSTFARPNVAKRITDQILEERQHKWENDQISKNPTHLLKAGRKWKAKYKLPPLPDPAFRFPDSWAPVTLGHVAWSVKDGPHFSPSYPESGVPFITGGNVRPEGIDFVNCRHISPGDHEKFAKRCKPERGDLLYTKGGTTGIARVNSYDIDFSVWVHVAVLKLVPSIDPFFLQHILNSPPCYAQAQKFTHGVGNQDLGLTRMVNITFGLPSFPEQKRIVAEVDRELSLVAEIDNLVNLSIRNSARLRQAILAKAFSGQLVQQDPSDEPASVLLERIRRERNLSAEPSRKRKRPQLVTP